MSAIVRSMLRRDDGPAVGAEDNMLGVRIPPHPRSDVMPDGDGLVGPESGGLSVNCDWKKMHLNHIPKRFNHIVQFARGSNNKSLWKLGTVPFENGPVAEGLNLRLTSSNHALVEPSVAVPIDGFQSALANTRPQWHELTPEAQ